MEEKSKRYAGLTFLDALGLIFITLKLCNVIQWGWMSVLSPLIAKAIVWIVFLVIAVLLSKPKGKQYGKNN